MNPRKFAAKIVELSLFPLTMAGGGGEQSVSYSKDVKPVLDQYCIECHQAGGEGTVASGFATDSYENLMKGTRNGPMVIAGDAEGSNLIVLMEGRADPSISMPHGKQDSVPKQQIQEIRKWIEQGAKNN